MLLVCKPSHSAASRRHPIAIQSLPPRPPSFNLRFSPNLRLSPYSPRCTPLKLKPPKSDEMDVPTPWNSNSMFLKKCTIRRLVICACWPSLPPRPLSPMSLSPMSSYPWPLPSPPLPLEGSSSPSPLEGSSCSENLRLARGGSLVEGSSCSENLRLARGGFLVEGSSCSENLRLARGGSLIEGSSCSENLRLARGGSLLEGSSCSESSSSMDGSRPDINSTKIGTFIRLVINGIIIICAGVGCGIVWRKNALADWEKTTVLKIQVTSDPNRIAKYETEVLIKRMRRNPTPSSNVSSGGCTTPLKHPRGEIEVGKDDVTVQIELITPGMKLSIKKEKEDE